MVNSIETVEDFNKLMEVSKEKLVVIDFWASWCGPCQFIGPIFVQLAETTPEVEFAKVDVDEADELAAKCGISAMPTFQFYKDGKMVEEMKGADKSKLVQLIEKYK